MAQTEKKILVEVIKIAIPKEEVNTDKEVTAVNYATALDGVNANLRALCLVIGDILKKGDRKKSNIIRPDFIPPKIGGK